MRSRAPGKGWREYGRACRCLFQTIDICLLLYRRPFALSGGASTDARELIAADSCCHGTVVSIITEVHNKSIGIFMFRIGNISG